MSWLPSPSPSSKLGGLYGEVGMPMTRVLGTAAPGVFGSGVSAPGALQAYMSSQQGQTGVAIGSPASVRATAIAASAIAATAVPIAVSGGGLPYTAPTVTAASRQGSWTPAPASAPSPTGGYVGVAQMQMQMQGGMQILSPTANRLRGQSPAPPAYQPVSLPADQMTRRSYTPLPVSGVSAQPGSQVSDDPLNHSLTRFIVPTDGGMVQPMQASPGGALAAVSAALAQSPGASMGVIPTTAAAMAAAAVAQAAVQEQRYSHSRQPSHEATPQNRGRGRGPAATSLSPSPESRMGSLGQGGFRPPTGSGVSGMSNGFGSSNGGFGSLSSAESQERALPPTADRKRPGSEQMAATRSINGHESTPSKDSTRAMQYDASKDAKLLISRFSKDDKDDERGPDSPRGPHPSTPSGAGAEERSRFTHRPRQPSLTQAPAAVTINVYWQRSVAFDNQGRVMRSMGGGDLSWGKKFLKDMLGVYHVGVEIHGDEYTFGNYRAPNSKRIGVDASGVYRHEPQKPGPHYVYKQGVQCGTTLKTKVQVEEICQSFGGEKFHRSKYNRIHHNCVDFCRQLTEKLGAGDIPLWCYRGAATAKLLGIGGEAPDKEELENGFPAGDEIAGQYEGGAEGAVMMDLDGMGPNDDIPLEIPLTAAAPMKETNAASRPPRTPMRQLPGGEPMPSPGGNGYSNGGAARASEVPQPAAHNSASPQLSPGSQAIGAELAPEASPAISSVTAAARAAEEALAAVAPGGLPPGRWVSVWQSAGGWALGCIVCQDPDGRYTVQYDGSHQQEAGVGLRRIVPLPEVPRETTALAQAFHFDGARGVMSQGSPPAPVAPSGTSTLGGMSTLGGGQPQPMAQQPMPPPPMATLQPMQQMPVLSGFNTANGAVAGTSGFNTATAPSSGFATCNGAAVMQGQAPPRIPSGVASATAAPMRYTSVAAAPAVTAYAQRGGYSHAMSPAVQQMTRATIVQQPRTYQAAPMQQPMQQPRDLGSTWRY